MNTKRESVQKLRAFFASSERFLFLNGTHQHEKHPLAIAAAVEFTADRSTILFRGNSASNNGIFLRGANIPQVPKPGSVIRLGRHLLCVDTINPASWRKTRRPIDIAIVYPVDSLKSDKADECIRDLDGRGARKILLVTWTDNKTFSWTNHLDPVRVTYDAEAEQPEYHERMKRIEGETMADDPIRGLPRYAQSVPRTHLCQIHCRKCSSRRWARLNQPYPGVSALQSAQTGQYRAVCLKCGEEASDNYNWDGRE